MPWRSTEAKTRMSSPPRIPRHRPVSSPLPPYRPVSSLPLPRHRPVSRDPRGLCCSHARVFLPSSEWSPQKTRAQARDPCTIFWHN